MENTDGIVARADCNRNPKKYFPAFLLNFRRNTSNTALERPPPLKNLTNDLTGERVGHRRNELLNPSCKKHLHF